ncbi:hypothetical protein DPMN_150061 [Dreissena polymorpha]|uniref:Uncharacterized protein n=1 Tax=Dreissena polymorpha TaxID=45954 RepID=A0A9D4FCR5_DREPO|nr:hypothetical protein DPMN_150061 [Dreissena polymorpha]
MTLSGGNIRNLKRRKHKGLQVVGAYGTSRRRHTRDVKRQGLEAADTYGTSSGGHIRNFKRRKNTPL